MSWIFAAFRFLAEAFRMGGIGAVILLMLLMFALAGLAWLVRKRYERDREERMAARNEKAQLITATQAQGKLLYNHFEHLTEDMKKNREDQARINAKSIEALHSIEKGCADGFGRTDAQHAVFLSEAQEQAKSLARIEGRLDR